MKILVFLLAVAPLCSAEVFFPRAEPGTNEYLFLSEDGSIGQVRHRRYAAPPAAAPQLNYRPYSQAPVQIQHLLQTQQAREPITHIAAQPLPQFSKAPSAAQQPQYQKQSQVSQYSPQVQYGKEPQQPQYQAQQPPPAQYRPQYQSQPQNQAQHAPQYRPAPQQAQYAQQPQASQPNYGASYRPTPQAQPSNGPEPHYSNNLPPQIQQLLQAQAQLPNSIPTGHQQGPPPSKAFRPEQRPLY